MGVVGYSIRNKKARVYICKDCAERENISTDSFTKLYDISPESVQREVCVICGIDIYHEKSEEAQDSSTEMEKSELKLRDYFEKGERLRNIARLLDVEYEEAFVDVGLTNQFLIEFDGDKTNNQIQTCIERLENWGLKYNIYADNDQEKTTVVVDRK